MSCYNKLGDQCSSRTIALTSNSKFFPPLDAMYYKNWVPVNVLVGKTNNETGIKHQHYASKPQFNFPQHMRRNTNNCSSCRK